MRPERCIALRFKYSSDIKRSREMRPECCIVLRRAEGIVLRRAETIVLRRAETIALRFKFDGEGVDADRQTVQLLQDSLHRRASLGCRRQLRLLLRPRPRLPLPLHSAPSRCQLVSGRGCLGYESYSDVTGIPGSTTGVPGVIFWGKQLKKS